MKTIELNDDDWARLKRKMMNGSVDDALKDYTPPVKLTHGTEYITYEKEGYEDIRSRFRAISAQMPSCAIRRAETLSFRSLLLSTSARRTATGHGANTPTGLIASCSESAPKRSRRGFARAPRFRLSVAFTRAAIRMTARASSAGKFALMTWN